MVHYETLLLLRYLLILLNLVIQWVRMDRF